MKIRNPKSEIRNKLEARNSKRFSFSFFSAFGISDLFRISCFGFRICFATFLLQTLELHAQETSNHWKRLPDLPDPIGVAGAFAGVSGGALIVAGGANFPDAPPWEGGKKVWYDTIWALEKPDGEWKKVGKLPKPNGYGVSVTLTNGVLCAGGGDASNNFSDVFLISYAGGQITFAQWPSLPKPCANSSGALVGDKIYIAGGIEFPTAVSAMSTFWCLAYTNKKPRWNTLKSWPANPRQLAVAGTASGRFCLFGGTALEAGGDGKPVRTYLRDAFCYTPLIDEWTKLADMPFNIAASPIPAANASESRLVIFGGDDAPSDDPKAHRGFRDEMLKYDPVENRWIAIGHMPAPRATAPVVFWNGGYVVVSGEVRRGVRSREVWMWTP